MNTKLNDLKTELREFLELSKTITQGKWEAGEDKDMVYRQPGKFGQAAGIIVHGRNSGISSEQDEKDATFIARSRNISPAMAECLLGVIEWLDLYAIPTEEADKQLQQILNIWEASK